MPRYKLIEAYKFGSFVPDMDDVNALISTETEFMKNFDFAKYRKGMNEAEEKHHLYACGFNRGCAWMLNKLRKK